MTANGTTRVLVVAAHPDDEILGCGGTIARLTAEGAVLRVVFLAEGITARYDPEEFDRPDVVAQSRERNDNAFKALALLGVATEEVFVSDRPCCRLDQVPQIDLVKEIEGHVRDFRPSELMTHAALDTNVDHRLAHQATLAAIRPLDNRHLRRVLAFEVLSSTEWNPTGAFHANAFYEIGERVEDKIAAMAAYGDEMRQPPHPRSAEVIRALARFRGAQAGVDFAEGFTLIRSLD